MCSLITVSVSWSTWLSWLVLSLLKLELLAGRLRTDADFDSAGSEFVLNELLGGEIGVGSGFCTAGAGASWGAEAAAGRGAGAGNETGAGLTASAAGGMGAVFSVAAMASGRLAKVGFVCCGALGTP
jgi:hypothetical protein